MRYKEKENVLAAVERKIDVKGRQRKGRRRERAKGKENERETERQNEAERRD